MRARSLVLASAILLLPVILAAQAWNLVDMGVGLVIEDADYDRVLRIAERGEAWDLKQLYENGALAGKYKGNQRFAAWIQGPAASNPVWYYKYTITYPDGKTFSAGPHGFYAAGHATVAIQSGPYTDGNWSISFSIWNKNTQETRPVGTVRFSTTWGAPAAAAWQLEDAGAGIYDQTNYDTRLVILERGEAWSQKRLYEQGYLANREKVFGVWLKGPPVSTYTDENGVPKYLYAMRVTYPNGSAQDFGPYSFYLPGFATSFLNVSGQLGAWKVDFYLVTRATGEKRHLKQLAFTVGE